ncbi:unnamed protein product [Boreogadus saida]
MPQANNMDAKHCSRQTIILDFQLKSGISACTTCGSCFSACRLRTAQVLRSHRSLLFLRLALFLTIQVNILKIRQRWHRTSGTGCHVHSTGICTRIRTRGASTGPASRGPSTGLTSRGHGRGPSTGLASRRPAGRGLASRRLNPGPDNRRPSTRPASRGPTGAVRRISGASRPLLSMWTRKAFMSHISTLKTFELS